MDQKRAEHRKRNRQLELERDTKSGTRDRAERTTHLLNHALDHVEPDATAGDFRHCLPSRSPAGTGNRPSSLSVIRAAISAVARFLRTIDARSTSRSIPRRRRPRDREHSGQVRASSRTCLFRFSGRAAQLGWLDARDRPRCATGDSTALPGDRGCRGRPGSFSRESPASLACERTAQVATMRGNSPTPSANGRIRLATVSPQSARRDSPGGARTSRLRQQSANTPRPSPSSVPPRSTGPTTRSLRRPRRGFLECDRALWPVAVVAFDLLQRLANERSQPTSTRHSPARPISRSSVLRGHAHSPLGRLGRSGRLDFSRRNRRRRSRRQCHSRRCRFGLRCGGAATGEASDARLEDLRQVRHERFHLGRSTGGRSAISDPAIRWSMSTLRSRTSMCTVASVSRPGLRRDEAVFHRVGEPHGASHWTMRAAP